MVLIHNVVSHLKSANPISFYSFITVLHIGHKLKEQKVILSFTFKAYGLFWTSSSILEQQSILKVMDGSKNVQRKKKQDSAFVETKPIQIKAKLNSNISDKAAKM